ncbi:MAG: NADH-quinone oxidoreductase subunit J [Actinomycetota bacterium]|nr:NADH-quinone oxidoreductase subunit J [Actinomycetota bacterium]
MVAVLAQAASAQPSTAEFFVFVVIGAISLGSALCVVILRNAVHAALMLVVNFFTIAVFYAVLEAQFLATVQVIVYAGAIMVLFLFVLMLLGVDAEQDLRANPAIPAQRPAAAVLGLVLFAALAISVAGPYLQRTSACPSGEAGAAAADTAASMPCAGLAAANEQGNTQGVGALLFGEYVWPFEVTSVLLVIAALGAMVLGRKDERPEDLVDVHVEAGPVEADPVGAYRADVGEEV